VYIADAPYQQLHLISRHALHDWHWLMVEMNWMDEIGTIAFVVNVLGILICVAGICAGIYFVGMDGYRLFTEKETKPAPNRFFSND
jgi:hypothetical protein